MPTLIELSKLIAALAQFVGGPMSPEPTRTLELDDRVHQRHRRLEWIAERCGMGLIAIVIITALLGMLGPGRLNRRIVTSSDGMVSVDHHTIQRYQAPAQLLITCQVPAGASVTRLSLSRSFTDQVIVEGIVPEPEVTELAGDVLVYRFRASERPGDGRILIRFKHNEYGSARYTVKVGDSEIQLSEFVLP